MISTRCFRTRSKRCSASRNEAAAGYAYSALGHDRAGETLDGALALVEDEENELLFSAASIWEVVVKAARSRMDFQVAPAVLRRALIDSGYAELPVMEFTPRR